ncbi:MAG: tetratricopeptide repeat protein [Acidobacteriaceae bacterium]|nr:tetratricopeptide repeat protein [Acidobacteriaceae bacterium]
MRPDRVLAVTLLLVVSCGALAGQAVPGEGSAKPSAPKASSPAGIDRIAKEAQAARDEHRVDDAIALYKKGVGLKPSWDEGWWYLGSLYYDLDQFVPARDAFRHLTAVNPNAAPGWGMLGLCEYQTRQYDSALAHLRRASELGIGASADAISDTIGYHLALLLTRYEQYEQAMKILSTFAQRELSQPEYVEAMGLAALRKPVLPEELPPTERELVMDVGRTMYDAAGLRTGAAALEFKRILQKYPNEPNVHYLYGSFLMYADADAGLAELKKELDISPAHVPSLVAIAIEYVRRHEFKDALPYAEKAVLLGPESFAAHATLGRVLVEGDIDPARGLRELEMAEKIAPDSPQVRIALATAYTKAGRKEDAARERQEFLRLRKQNDENKTLAQ